MFKRAKAILLTGIIICGFCMPYLNKEDCGKLIKDCSSLMDDGGVFYFSFIEEEYSKSQYTSSSDGKHQMFIYSHEEKYLLEDLKTNQFEIVNIQRKAYAIDAKTNATHSIFLSKRIL